MNDLDMLRTMRADAPPPSPDVLARARSRLLDRAAARSRRYRPRLRAGWQTAAAATVAVVLGVGAIVATYERAGGPGDGASTTPGAQPTEQTGPDAVRAALAEAAAATRAAGGEAPEGRYWYHKVMYRVTRPDIGGDADEATHETWFRSGGNPGALGRIRFEYEIGEVIDAEYKNGDWVYYENGTRPEGFRDDPDLSGRWLPDGIAATAPTAAADVLDFLRNVPEGRNMGAGFGGVFGLLLHPILSPQQRAAACEALGELPDLTLVPDAVDIAGRHGLGIAYDDGWNRITLILDSSSCEVLGYETVLGDELSLPEGMQDAPELQPGSGMAEAIIDRGAVDSTDERP